MTIQKFLGLLIIASSLYITIYCKHKTDIKSQAGGEWQNGGYKTMKTDTGGKPITKIKEPQILKDYEDKKL